MTDKNIKKPEKISEKDFRLFLDNLENGRHLMAYYECALMEIETKFKVLNTEFSLEQDYNPIETIKTRVKTVESIVGKMQRKNLPLNIDTVEKEIYDVAGIRIVCPFIEDIYVLADCLLKQDDVTLVEKKDYIKNPKENGYRSLHLIVEIPIFLHNEKRPMKVEIQLRTIAMDFWASLEHRMRYKKNVDSSVAQQVAEELRACAEDSARLDVRMENVKNRIRNGANGTDSNC